MSTPTNQRTAIAGRLTAVVRERGLSVNRLAQLLKPLGVESNRQSLQAYLDGERDPSGPWMHAAALVLGVRPEWILTGEGARQGGNPMSFIEAENALVDAIAADAVNGFASERTLAALSAYRDRIYADAEARATARIRKLLENVTDVFAREVE